MQNYMELRDAETINNTTASNAVKRLREQARATAQRIHKKVASPIGREAARQNLTTNRQAMRALLANRNKKADN